MADTTLVTGFPAFAARRLVRHLLESDAAERVFVLCMKKFLGALDEFLQELPAEARARVEVLEGDVLDMDLGLTGREYVALGGTLTAIHHTATVSFLAAKRGLMRRVNVEGTRAILDLAGDLSKLRRLTHWSTARVAGTRAGMILESELEHGQRFFDLFEETKYRAEVLVKRAQSRLPITVVRPSTVVGDSQSGEIDKFDGPYLMMVLIVRAPVDVSLPLPGRGNSPLNLVPVDYVVAAAAALARDVRAEGRTFHLTDPCPFAARTVFEMVAARASRRAPRGMFPTGLARLLMRLPGLERFTGAPRSFMDAFNHAASYSCTGTLELLGGRIACPSLETYIDHLVDYVTKHAQLTQLGQQRTAAPRVIADAPGLGYDADPYEDALAGDDSDDDAGLPDDAAGATSTIVGAE